VGRERINNYIDFKIKQNGTDMNSFRQDSLEKLVGVYNDGEERSGVVSGVNPILELPILTGEYTVE